MAFFWLVAKVQLGVQVGRAKSRALLNLNVSLHKTHEIPQACC